MSALRVTRAGPMDHASIAELFRQSDVPCFCQYFGFGGDHRMWQDRCANDPAENQAGLLRDLGRPDFRALVAFRGAQAVGWARLAPREQLKKTYNNRLYRNLPCLTEEGGSVFAVACFLVHPTDRRKGVARQLLAHLIEEARGCGATSLEAFPRGHSDVSDEEQWTGPLSLYQSAGFSVVHDFAPYPVLRLKL